MQGACDSAPGPEFTTGAAGRTSRQCVIQGPRRVLTMEGSGARHWLDNLSFQLSRPEAELNTARVLVNAATVNGQVWIQHCNFVGDDGPAQAIDVHQGTRAYIAGAPALALPRPQLVAATAALQRPFPLAVAAYPPARPPQ